MDVVGISAITRTQPPSYDLARRLKEWNPNIRILFGGPHVTAFPEEALQYGDVVVRREGDATLVKIAERLAEDLEDPFLGASPGFRSGTKRVGSSTTPKGPFSPAKSFPVCRSPTCLIRF
jgi:radical SAM superfamily enzyme YgiQ (UPF0313 family)